MTCVSRGTRLKHLPPPKNSSASLGKGYGGKHLVMNGVAWCLVSQHLCCTVSSRLVWAASLTVLGKGGELKNWMLEQPVKTKGCSSIQFLLREFC